MKKISIVWGVIVVMLFTGLTIFGFLYQDIKKYKYLEDKMEKYAKLYVEKQDNYDLDKDNKITLETLKKFRPKADFSVEDDTCDGYVKITKWVFGYRYNAEIKCKNYKNK